MKKLLFITTRLCWPTDNGRKVSLYYYCKGLHEKYGYQIYLYSFLEYEQTKELVKDKPDFIEEVHVAKKVGFFTKVINLIHKAIFCGAPFQNCLFWSNKNYREIRKLCKKENFDVVMVDMVRLAPYYKAFKDMPCKKILDLDDLLSKRYMRQAEKSRVEGNLLGVYSKKTSKKASISSFGFIKKLILKSESKRVAKAERKFGKLYEQVVFVSDKETNEYNKKSDKKNAFTVRLGVDYEYFSTGEIINREKGAIAFLGNLKVAANVESLSIIINEILPRLKNKYRLYVVGVCPENVRKRFENNGIVFYGRVEDVRAIIKRCEVFLSPIAFGSGVKTKILEAMAMGVPVVSNSLGIEGIDGVNGRDFLVSDNYSNLAKETDRIIENSNLSESISKNAKLLMKDKYDWNVVYKAFSEMKL